MSGSQIYNIALMVTFCVFGLPELPFISSSQLFLNSEHKSINKRQ
jgi:hypothetical protein